MAQATGCQNSRLRNFLTMRPVLTLEDLHSLLIPCSKSQRLECLNLFQFFTASFIKPCKATDKECIRTSAQKALPYFAKGIPEIGVPVVDPIAIDAVGTDEPSLQLSFKNITVSGVTKCKIIELEWVFFTHRSAKCESDSHTVAFILVLLQKSKTKRITFLIEPQT